MTNPQGEPQAKILPLVENIKWEGALTRLGWMIADEKTIPIQTIMRELRQYITLHQAVEGLIQEPSRRDEQTRQITLSGTFFNEGKSNGIGLLRGEDEVIIVVAKNLDEGAKQTRQDAINIATLKHKMPQNSKFRVPYRIGDIIELPIDILRPEKTLPVYRLEYLKNFFESSCRRGIDGKAEFVVNIPDPDVQPTMGVQQSEIATREAFMIASAQTVVYFALDGRIQNNLAINHGDYMVGHDPDGNLAVALITLNDGLTNQLTIEEFIYRTITHHEVEFNPQTGNQKAEVYPFADHISEALSGVAEGMAYYAPSEADVRTQIIQALESMQKREEFANLPEQIRTEITQGIQPWTAKHP